MRADVAVLMLVLGLGVNSCRHAGRDVTTPDASSEPAPELMPPPEAPEPVPVAETQSAIQAGGGGVPAAVSFEGNVKPILEARCQPCHFPGGVMYERRPFDRAETITTLGTKLFSRIKDEDERRVISEFLAQEGAAQP